MGLGGAERVVADLCAIDGVDAGVAWLTGDMHPRWREPLRDTRQYPIRMRGVRSMAGAIRRLSNAIDEFDADVVHTHLVHAHLAGRAAAVGSGRRCAVISTEHNLGYIKRGAGLLNGLNARTSRINRKIVCISDAVRGRCQSFGMPDGRMQVIYNGISAGDPEPASIEAQKAALGYNPTRPLAMMVGRLVPEKGADLFVEMLRQTEEIDGLMIGDGVEAERIAELSGGIVGRPRFHWEKNVADISSRFAAADVVVVPSRREGLGIVALEAMAASRPVVATRIGGLPEVVQHEVTGLIIDPESPAALSEAVRRLLANPELARGMGMRGRERVLENFTVDEMRNRYLELYRSVT
jgi:glycosyltransferase involved in cell wall biosynthesis